MDAVHRGSVLGRSHAAGLRKLTPKMLGTLDICEHHNIQSALLPGKVLAAFKAAAPYLGLRPNVVHVIDWLFRFTQSIDWQPSARPIVWPSAEMQQRDMGLGVSQVKNLNRHLVELGLVVMKDSPNRKRYGRRDASGRIADAYGFDLSPLASRYDEFLAIAEAGREERARIQAFRRRATIARNGIRQLLETAMEQGVADAAWESYRTAASSASQGIAALGAEAEMAVGRLERLQGEMRQYLEASLNTRRTEQERTSRLPVNLDPRQPKNRPHITSTNQLLNPKDTVIIFGEGLGPRTIPSRQGPSVSGEGGAVGPSRSPGSSVGDGKRRDDFESVLKITPSQMVNLAPRLKTYLASPCPRWPEIVDAADWLREELGISKFTWGNACATMGRQQAAVAVAIVSTKPAGYFRESAGAYLHGMVRRARCGELHLTRTLWGMRTEEDRPSRRQ